MPILLATLGSSPMILPEALLVSGTRYAAVHIFTSDSPQTDTTVLQPLLGKIPETTFTVTRLLGFSDLSSQEEHDFYEEGLYHWYLKHLQSNPSELPHVCIAGGFKSMVAGLQKAAQLFGASCVFHVLADFPPPQQPRDLDAVESAHLAGRLRRIDLGPEPGWPSLRALNPSKDVSIVRTDGIQQWIQLSKTPSLVQRIREIQDKTYRQASGWEHLPRMPFSILALQSPERIEQLNQPLSFSQSTDYDWVKTLPKIELHSHMGGYATHGETLYAIRASAEAPAKLPPLQEPEFPADWPLPPEPCGLDPYRKLGDANGSAILSDLGCLREHCRQLYSALIQDHVLYAEIRCSPANYTKQGHTAWTILETIRKTFEDCMYDASQLDSISWCQVNLIIIATRKPGGDLSDISRHLGLAITAAQEHPQSGKCSVVGVDLAGFESPETRPHYFQHSFEAAHRCGLAVTVHAGENDDSESIWQAVHRLFARRLGHALKLEEARDLLRTVADRRIGVEMCPYANFQIHGYPLDPNDEDPHSYPLLRYLKAGIPVSINTDNIGISDASLSDNCLLLSRLCPGFSRLHLLQTQRNAIESAFISPDFRESITKRFSQALSRHIAKHS